MSVAMQTEAQAVAALRERCQALAAEVAQWRASDRMPGGWHSPERVAAFLGMAAHTVRLKARAGEFGPVMTMAARPAFSRIHGREVFRGRIRISGRGVNEWVERQKVEAAA